MMITSDRNTRGSDRRWGCPSEGLEQCPIPNSAGEQVLTSQDSLGVGYEERVIITWMVCGLSQAHQIVQAGSHVRRGILLIEVSDRPHVEQVCGGAY